MRQVTEAFKTWGFVLDQYKTGFIGLRGGIKVSSCTSCAGAGSRGGGGGWGVLLGAGYQYANVWD
jgi:hypothetical protein